MNDTPRTNEAQFGTGRVSVDFARQLERENNRLRAELENIANAKPHTWGEESDQFQAWAQSRARHTLAIVAVNKEDKL